MKKLILFALLIAFSLGLKAQVEPSQKIANQKAREGQVYLNLINSYSANEEVLVFLNTSDDTLSIKYGFNNTLLERAQEVRENYAKLNLVTTGSLVIDSLNLIISENEDSIASLNAEKIALESQVSDRSAIEAERDSLLAVIASLEVDKQTLQDTIGIVLASEQSALTSQEIAESLSSTLQAERDSVNAVIVGLQNDLTGCQSTQSEAQTAINENVALETENDALVLENATFRAAYLKVKAEFDECVGSNPGNSRNR